MKIKEKIMSNRNDIVIFIALVLIAVLGRLLPHPANLTPVGAIALFGGYYFKKQSKIILPLLAMFISDCCLGFYDLKLMLIVYFCIFLNAILGSFLANRKLLGKAAGFSVLGSIIFFTVTNFGVWAFSSWYPHTAIGLAYCYYLGLPFFRNTLLGDLFFTLSIFSVYQLIYNYARANQSAWLADGNHGNN
ncbi:MAG: hypothetical protein NTW06_01905 [Candidatus Falkowbacteria bacterium]|nr:hypothetical protein [Candidatus Falkowbacteria bacterium]